MRVGPSKTVSAVPFLTSLASRMAVATVVTATRHDSIGVLVDPLMLTWSPTGTRLAAALCEFPSQVTNPLGNARHSALIADRVGNAIDFA